MGILETLAIILLVVWVGGFLLHVGGVLINLLLMLAVGLFIVRLFRTSAR